VKQCYYTKHFDNKTTIFKDTSIENINFRVVSGIVDITFHNDPFVTVDVMNKYRDARLIKKRNILSEVTLNQGTIQIVSENPSFNLQECHHSQIHIALPRKYQKSISLTGFIKTGYVRVHGDGYVHTHGNATNVLDKVDIVVEVGAINIDRISSKSISLSTDLGCIEVSESVAVDSTKLLAHTGSIRSHDLISKDIQAVTKYGSSLHKGLVSDKIVVNTKWGYSSVQGASSANTQDITLKTEYGKSVLSLENNNVEFHLENRRGLMLVEYEDEKWDCKLESKSAQTVLMNGKCVVLKKELSSHSRVNVHVDTQFGDSVLIVDQIKKDD